MQWSDGSRCPGPCVAVTGAPQEDGKPGVHGHQGPEPGKELSQEERESSPKLTGNMSVPKMLPSWFFPFALQEEPRKMFPGSSRRTATELDPAPHTRGSDPAASPAVPGSSGVDLCYWPGSGFASPCRAVWSKGVISSHCLPSHIWELTPGNARGTLLGSQKHSRKALTGRGLQVPVPGREEHTIPFHCPLHLCRSC